MNKKIDIDIQKLIFKGSVTSDEKTLKECGVKENEFLVLLISKVILLYFLIYNQSSLEINKTK